VNLRVLKSQFSAKRFLGEYAANHRNVSRLFETGFGFCIS